MFCGRMSININLYSSSSYVICQAADALIQTKTPLGLSQKQYCVDGHKAQTICKKDFVALWKLHQVTT